MRTILKRLGLAVGIAGLVCAVVVVWFEVELFRHLRPLFRLLGVY
jgi:hypothetical protein